MLLSEEIYQEKFPLLHWSEHRGERKAGWEIRKAKQGKKERVERRKVIEEIKIGGGKQKSERNRVKRKVS